MRTGLSMLVAAALMTLVSACGDEDDEGDAGGSAIEAVEIPEGELTGAELAEAADSVCSAGTAELDKTGNRGLTNAGIAAEFTAGSEIQRERAEKMAEIEAGTEDAEAWDAFLESERKLADSTAAVVTPAEAEDQNAVNAALEKVNTVAAERTADAEALDLQVCGTFPPYEVEETGTGPSDGLSYAEPSNDVTQAVEALIAAADSGDCAKITKARSTENPEMPPPVCESFAAAYGGAKVLGTEQYGPVGVAEVQTTVDGVLTSLFVTDEDRVMRQGGDAINDGVGLRPANEDNDADQIAAESVEVIRASDSAAFNELLSLNSTTPEDGGFQQSDDESFTSLGDTEEGKQIVEDIRADDEAQPEPLGINQAYGLFYLEANGNGYVFALDHEPGSRGGYRFGAFFSVPTQ